MFLKKLVKNKVRNVEIIREPIDEVEIVQKAAGFNSDNYISFERVKEHLVDLIDENRELKEKNGERKELE